MIRGTTQMWGPSIVSNRQPVAKGSSNGEGAEVGVQGSRMEQIIVTPPATLRNPCPDGTDRPSHEQAATREPIVDLSRAWSARIGRFAHRRAHDAAVRIALRFGGALYQDTPDRAVLENVIFPYYQLSDEHRSLLFVGCDWYTTGYARRFALKSYATIDPDRARARYGAPRHAIAPMSLLGDHHPSASLDVVFCNGVIGFGLDDPAEADASFSAAFDALRPGGHFILGWNDVPRHRPFELSGIPALARFEPLVFAPLRTARHRVAHDIGHVFDFYRKPER